MIKNIIRGLLRLFLVMFLFNFISCQSRDELTEINIKPNVIFILVDDLRWDEFGEGGHNYIKTPNIDRIAHEGMRFMNAFATTALCSPSRASFLTGQYAHTHGIIDNTERSSASHKLLTFPMKVDSLGYQTAFIGKWHMGNDNTRRPGFDFWAALKGQGEANNPEFNVNGENIKTNGYVTDVLTKYSIDFLNSNTPEKPFLLYLSHKGLHPNLHQDATGKVTKIQGGGFISADRHKGMYSDSVFDRRPNAGVTPLDKPALMRSIDDLPVLGRTSSTPENVIQERAEMLMAIDEGLGEIFITLEKSNNLDNTIIVLAGDHGYWYGEHGLNEERRLGYEEGIRIPLLVRYPPLVKKGDECDELVLNIDLAPTIIELTGGKPSSSIEGRSLVPLLKRGKTQNWRTSFMIEYYSDTVWPRMLSLGYKGIRSEQYKYIQYSELTGMDEFYDLKKDPYELKNLINDVDYNVLISEFKNNISLYD